MHVPSKWNELAILRSSSWWTRCYLIAQELTRGCNAHIRQVAWASWAGHLHNTADTAIHMNGTFATCGVRFTIQGLSFAPDSKFIGPNHSHIVPVLLLGQCRRHGHPHKSGTSAPCGVKFTLTFNQIELTCFTVKITRSRSIPSQINSKLQCLSLFHRQNHDHSHKIDAESTSL